METAIKHIIPYFTEHPQFVLLSEGQAYVLCDESDRVFREFITASN